MLLFESPRPARVLWLAATLSAAALVATACGAGGAAQPVQPTGPTEQVLTQLDVDVEPVGTPAHGLLAWWRNAQFANLVGFLNGFEESVQRTLRKSPRTGDALAYFAGSIRNARPTIVDVQQDGGRATVYTRIDYRQAVGSTRFVVHSVPRAFSMILQAGNWRLRDDSFVQSSLSEELKRRGA
jgi:hypothetical protein